MHTSEYFFIIVRSLFGLAAQTAAPSGPFTNLSCSGKPSPNMKTVVQSCGALRRSPSSPQPPSPGPSSNGINRMSNTFNKNLYATGQLIRISVPARGWSNCTTGTYGSCRTAILGVASFIHKKRSVIAQLQLRFMAFLYFSGSAWHRCPPSRADDSGKSAAN